ncbi:MAG: MoxR family ATPase [Tissierellaceae bacterium]|nr:MoxR family ATPase [Tissierellaceae bacterium]
MNSLKILAILNNLKEVILGKDHVLKNVLICLLARGHLLIEDVPGVGKTSLAKALAKSLDLSYKRIQFTPDLMPSDILGINIYDRDSGTFVFKKGPIFNHIFLADEINRTSPKTQSSLLQVMEEGELSTEDNHYILEKPFMVLATQNPLEYQGTFPLPEAQLDRFLMRISIGYPNKQFEIQILKENYGYDKLDTIDSVISKDEIIEMQNLVDNISVHEDVMTYIVNIVHTTRTNPDLRLGASPRASIDLLKASKARAFVEGRHYVIPDDVKSMVVPVLSHRLIPSSEAKIDGKSMDVILHNIVNEVFIPVIVND